MYIVDITQTPNCRFKVTVVEEVQLNKSIVRDCEEEDSAIRTIDSALQFAQVYNALIRVASNCYMDISKALYRQR